VNSSVDRKIHKLLMNERDGPHGESERRYAAEWALDHLDNTECEDDPMPVEDALDYLAEAVTDLAGRIRALRD
jgi:hypothetical protein